MNFSRPFIERPIGTTLVGRLHWRPVLLTVDRNLHTLSIVLYVEHSSLPRRSSLQPTSIFITATWKSRLLIEASLIGWPRFAS